jgi:hypothetical protein
VVGLALERVDPGGDGRGGFHVWVHTLAEPERIDAFADRGIGVYTDGYIACGDGP